MTRLTISSAVCAVALALLSGCSPDNSTEAGPATPAVASSSPAGGAPVSASASAAANGEGAALCEQVAAAKRALNEELRRVAGPDGKIPPAEGKRLMTGLAAALNDLAASGDGEVADALHTLAAEASKAAKAADPVRAATSTSFDTAGRKLDNACTHA